MAWLLAAQCPRGGGCGRAAADMLRCWWGGVEGLKEGSGGGGSGNNRCATALSGWWHKRKVCWGAFPLLGLCCGRAADRGADTLACAARSWPKGIMGGGAAALALLGHWGRAAYLLACAAHLRPRAKLRGG